MSRTIRCLAFAVAFVAVEAHAQWQEVRLRAGTLTRCTLREPGFSSRTAQIGEPVICYAYPLPEFGISVSPPRSHLTGRFMDYKDPGRGGCL